MNTEQDDTKKVRCLLEAAKNAYLNGDKLPKTICANKLMLYDLSDTLKLYMNKQFGVIIVSIRGTSLTDPKDIAANFSLASNSLTSTNRFTKDKLLFDSWVKKFPPTEYDYYMAGHSLGGPILTEFLRLYPFVKFSVSFNAAYQLKDFKDPTHVINYYSSADPLYMALGRYMRNLRVVKYSPAKVNDFFNFAKTLMIPKNIRAHSLDQFDQV